MSLVFVPDPMCSWCYGFAKELTALSSKRPVLPLKIVVGGVRAGDTAIMTEEMKQFRLGHWARVESASGLPFNRQAFSALEHFVYDTVRGLSVGLERPVDNHRDSRGVDQGTRYQS